MSSSKENSEGPVGSDRSRRRPSRSSAGDSDHLEELADAGDGKNYHFRDRVKREEDREDEKHDGDESNDGPGGLRRLRRHQKVRLWLTTFREGLHLDGSTSAEAAAAAAASPDDWRAPLAARPEQRSGAALTAWSAFDDSGTFSADSRLESQFRSRGTTAVRSSFLGNASISNARLHSSSTPTIGTAKSSQSSLSQLLMNRLRLRSCSTQPIHGENYSVRSVTADWRHHYHQNQHSQQQQHNENQEAAAGESSGSSRAASTSKATGKNSVSKKTGQSRAAGGSPSTAPTEAAGSQKPLQAFLAKSVVKPSVASNEDEQQQQQQRATGRPTGRATSTAASGPDDPGVRTPTGDSSSSYSEDAEQQRQPEPYHVRVLPAMCYLVWRPNMLRRECLIEQGQTAYLNALHPSSLPMECLMAAVAARLDIQVPLLDAQRPDWPGKPPKFEYIFRWHSPNGPRIQLTDLITEIEHPAIQSGFPGSPVRIFLSGSPGWLAKAK